MYFKQRSCHTELTTLLTVDAFLGVIFLMYFKSGHGDETLSTVFTPEELFSAVDFLVESENGLCRKNLPAHITCEFTCVPSAVIDDT